MRSDYHGINIERAATLADELARWVPQVAEISGDVLLAESLSDLRAELQGEFEDLSLTGSSLARAISTASSGMLAHRLAVDEQFKRLNGVTIAVPTATPMRRRRATGEDPVELARTVAEAQTIIDRQRLAVASGHPTSTGDRDRLTEIFGKYIDDSATAAVALALALNGSVPAAHALGYTSVAEIEAEFDRVAQNMRAGIDPAHDVLPAGMYPDTYRTWIDQRSPKRSRTRSAFGPVGERLRVPGLLGREFVLPYWTRPRAVALDEWQAASALALHLGPASSSWLGRSIAAGASGEWGFQAAVEIAEIVASDPAAALAMFNTLDAQGTADIPHRLATRDIAASEIALPDLARALASVSGHPDLVFSGAELIEADHRPNKTGNDVREYASQFVEQLLLAHGFDASFLLGAAAISLGTRDGRNRQRVPPRRTEFFDPRSTALAAVAMNTLGAELALAIGAGGVPGLLDARHTEGSYPALQSGRADERPLAPIEQVLLQIGNDPDAARVITETLGSDPSGWISVTDSPNIANGLSIMLSLAAGSYIHDNHAQPGFIETYDLALRGGSGVHLALLDRELVRAEVRSQVLAAQKAGTPIAIDLTDVALFLGDVEGTRLAALADEPSLVASATKQFTATFDALSLTFSIAALAPGPQALAFAIISIGLGFLFDDDADEENIEELFRADRTELVNLAREMDLDVLIGLRSAQRSDGPATVPLPVLTAAADPPIMIDGSPIPIKVLGGTTDDGEIKSAGDVAAGHRGRRSDETLEARSGR